MSKQKSQSLYIHQNKRKDFITMLEPLVEKKHLSLVLKGFYC